MLEYDSAKEGQSRRPLSSAFWIAAALVGSALIYILAFFF
jgi:hypothetical protein